MPLYKYPVPLYNMYNTKKDMTTYYILFFSVIHFLKMLVMVYHTWKQDVRHGAIDCFFLIVPKILLYM